MIAVRVKFLQSSGRIEWRQEVLRAVAPEEEMVLREFFLRRFNLLHPSSLPSASVSQPSIVSERERDKALMLVVVLLVAAMMETRVSQ